MYIENRLRPKTSKLDLIIKIIDRIQTPETFFKRKIN